MILKFKTYIQGLDLKAKIKKQNKNQIYRLKLKKMISNISISLFVKYIKMVFFFFDEFSFSNMGLPNSHINSISVKSLFEISLAEMGIYSILGPWAYGNSGRKGLKRNKIAIKTEIVKAKQVKPQTGDSGIMLSHCCKLTY